VVTLCIFYNFHLCGTDKRNCVSEIFINNKKNNIDVLTRILENVYLPVNAQFIQLYEL